MANDSFKKMNIINYVRMLTGAAWRISLSHPLFFSFLVSSFWAPTSRFFFIFFFPLFFLEPAFRFDFSVSLFVWLDCFARKNLTSLKWKRKRCFQRSSLLLSPLPQTIRQFDQIFMQVNPIQLHPIPSDTTNSAWPLFFCRWRFTNRALVGGQFNLYHDLCPLIECSRSSSSDGRE